MYTGASYGTWISPKNQYVAHGARSWESWVSTTLSGSEAHGRLHLTDTTHSRWKQSCHRASLVLSSGSRLGCTLQAADGYDLLIGFSSGEVVVVSLRQQLLESSRKLIAPITHNASGCFNASRCTNVLWYPREEGVFVSTHADGSMYVYDRVKEPTADPGFPAVSPPSRQTPSTPSLHPLYTPSSLLIRPGTF
eukprot:3973316-Pyramimonas_sp.AAC.1